MDWQGPTLIFNLREGSGSSVGSWYDSMVDRIRFLYRVCIWASSPDSIGKFINDGKGRTKKCIYHGEGLPKCLLWEVSWHSRPALLREAWRMNGPNVRTRQISATGFFRKPNNTANSQFCLTTMRAVMHCVVTMSHVLTLRCRRVGSQRWKTDNSHHLTDKSEQPGRVDFCWV